MTRPVPGRHWLDRGEGRRLFVAVPLGEEARAAVAGVMADLADDSAAAPPSPAAGAGPRPGGGGYRGHGAHARWVRAESLHVTLRFIGATPDDAIAALVGAVDEAAAGQPAFPCSLAGSGAFPAGPHPRVLWLGAGEGAAELGGLAARLEDALAARGWPRDERGFSAHLTLARTDGVATAADLARRLDARTRTLEARWVADRVVLFESVTGGGPARYVPVHVAILDETALATERPTR